MTTPLELKQYPVGRFDWHAPVTDADIEKSIGDIESFPSKLAEAISHITPEHLRTPYREGGWTRLQVIHHCADSHMNALVRFKLALTEDNPTIKPYREALWAELPDMMADPQVSIELLYALHHRWVILMRNMTAPQWDRTFFHPDLKNSFPLRKIATQYGWHCRHHFGHVVSG